MDYSSLSDDQLKQMLGGQAASAPAQGSASDYGSMSDEQLKQLLGGQAAPQKNYAVEDVPAAASKNAKASGDKFVQGIKDVVTHPVDAATGLFDTAVVGPASKLMRTSGLTDLLAGAGKGADEAALNKTLEAQKAGFREKATDQAADHFQGRYGGFLGGPGKWGFTPGQGAENVKRTFAEDPIGAFSDMLAVTGATPGRAAVAVPTRTARVADAVVRPLTEIVSGVSSEAQQLASRAGELGGAEGRAFRTNMANPDYAGMQDTLRQGVRGARAERGANYVGDMSQMGGAPMGYGGLPNALRNAEASAYGPGGFLKSQDVLDVVGDMRQAYQEHFLNPNVPRSAASMDALKQRLGIIMRGTEEGSNARRAAQDVYHSLRDEIATMEPAYDHAMNRWQGATRDIDEITKSLGAGERATRFSTTGKLLSALRSDASVARGARADALADVAQNAPTLPYQIAGATMNPILPRGIVGRGKLAFEAGLGASAGAAGLAGFLAHLAAAAPAIAASSPRLVGNARYGVGAATRGARRIGATQDNFSKLTEALRQYEQTDDK